MKTLFGWALVLVFVIGVYVANGFLGYIIFADRYLLAIAILYVLVFIGWCAASIRPIRHALRTAMTSHRSAFILVSCVVLGALGISCWLLIMEHPGPPYPGQQCPHADAKLSVTCFHHVVNHDTIHGVIIMRNIATEPVSLAEFGNG